MSIEDRRSAIAAHAGWVPGTRFAAIECSEELMRARQAAYGPDAVPLGCAAAAPGPEFALPEGAVCSITTDVIEHDGHAWLSVAAWCPDRSYLEILGEVMLV
jgi:hypothetical protein